MSATLNPAKAPSVPVQTLHLEANQSVIDVSVDVSDTPTYRPALDTSDPLAKQPTNQIGKVFISTFFTIFLAELGDKTQVATLLMSAESHHPWVVFAGAASALISTSLLGVLLGRWLSNRLAPRTLEVASGILLGLISLWLLWDILSTL